MDTKTLKKMPATLNAWIMAIRPRSLPIPTIQVLTGIALAYTFTEKIDLILAFYTWLVTVFITIGTNLINDVFDFEGGGDTLKSAGYLKVIRAGFLSKRQVYAGGLLAFGLAIICAFPLMLAGSWFMLPIVILSTICGYCYTGGPYPIGYLGFSEVFVFIFYGGVCIISTFFVQSHFINMAVILTSIQMGMLAILPNALNNFRDMFEDVKVSKLTLAVRFGKHFARREIAWLTFLPIILSPLWFFLGYSEAALFPFLLLPLAFLFVRSVWITEPGPIFNRYFILSVSVHFLFGTLLIIGWLLS